MLEGENSLTSDRYDTRANESGSRNSVLESAMPHYLFQASYTSQSWAALVKKPENRRLASSCLTTLLPVEWLRQLPQAAACHRLRRRS